MMLSHFLLKLIFIQITLTNCKKKSKISDFNSKESFRREYDKLPEKHKRRVDSKITEIPDNDFDHVHINEETGDIFYVEEVIIDDPNPKRFIEDTETVLSEATLVQITDSIPKLHSRFGASNVIYIDFDGEVIPKGSTVWAENKNADIKCAPFSFDSDPSTLSSYEISGITDIWSRVAEDYIPFNVDITTEKPSVMHDRVSHVVICGSREGVPGNTSGGVAHVGVHGTYVASKTRPAFCFPQNLGPYNFAYIGECVSHEAGHNMGLYHDGTSTAGYYKGQGQWAPIMGSSYGKQITQWSKGEYPGANNQQDDLTILSNVLGDIAVPTSAVPEIISASCSEIKSILTPKNRVVTFSFTTTGSNVEFKAYPPLDGVGNADLAMVVRCGKTTMTSSPDYASSTSKTFIITTGSVCTVSISSTGDAANSYSSYGSVGSFTVRYCNAKLNTNGITVGTAAPAIAPTSADSSFALPIRCCVYNDAGQKGTSVCGTMISKISTIPAIHKKISSYACNGSRIIFYDGEDFTGSNWASPCESVSTKGNLPTSWDNKPLSWRVVMCTPLVSGTELDGSVESEERKTQIILSWWAWTLIGVGVLLVCAAVFGVSFIIRLRRSIEEESIEDGLN